MPKYLEFLQEQLRNIVVLVRQDLTVLQRITLGALVVLDVHAKDIVQQIQEIQDVFQFDWISHLRYYYEHHS